MSNFLCVEAYFAVPKLRFLHKSKFNGYVELLFFSFCTYQPRLWWLSLQMIASQQNVASHQSCAYGIKLEFLSNHRQFGSTSTGSLCFTTISIFQNVTVLSQRRKKVNCQMNYHIHFYIKDDNILFYLFTYFIVLFYILQ